MSSEQRQAIFRPEVYEVDTLEQAKRVTVTAEQGTTTEERWEKETAFLIEQIGRYLKLKKKDCVLDYGCGVGRLAKAMIDQYGCRVIGVDTSKSMRDMAPEYVLSERFTVWSPEVLAKMTAGGFRFEKAICLWVLQHVLNPVETIDLIDSALAEGARFYVLNQDFRCVPTNLGYVNDGQDVGALLDERFERSKHLRLPEEVTIPVIAEQTSIYVLRKPKAAE